MLRGAPALAYFMYDTGEYVSDKMEPSKQTFPQVFRIAQGQLRIEFPVHLYRVEML